MIYICKYSNVMIFLPTEGFAGLLVSNPVVNCVDLEIFSCVHVGESSGMTVVISFATAVWGTVVVEVFRPI